MHLSNYSPEHNSKTNDPRVFKMTLGYPTSGMVFGSKGQMLGLGLGLTTIRHGFANSMNSFYFCFHIIILSFVCIFAAEIRLI